MKRSRFSGAQIIGILKEHQAGMIAGPRHRGIDRALSDPMPPRVLSNPEGEQAGIAVLRSRSDDTADDQGVVFACGHERRAAPRYR